MLRAAASFIDMIAALVEPLQDVRDLPRKRRDQQEELFRLASDLLQEAGEVRLEITPYEVRVMGRRLAGSEGVGAGLAESLYRDGVWALRMLPGLCRWELAELLGVLGAEEARAADLATTMWEKEWPHLVPELADPFEAGLVARPAPLSCQLVPGEHPRSCKGAGDPGLVGPMLEGWLAAAGQEHGAAALPELRDQVQGARTDLWRRGFSVGLRLIRTPRSEDPMALALAGVARRLMDAGNWGELAHLGDEVRWALGRRATHELRWRAEALRAALGKVFPPEWVLSLAEDIAASSLAAFEPLGKLLLVLPKEATPQLVAVLDELEQGEVGYHLMAILLLRGADLDERLARDLQGCGEEHALVAIRGMASVPSRRSVAALSQLLGHASHPVRRAALDSLGVHRSEHSIPGLVDCLARASGVEEAEKVVALLEEQPARLVSKHLLPLAQEADFWQRPASQRARLLRMLASADAPEAVDFLVRQVTQVSLTSARRVDAARREVLTAVVSAGGDRARKVLLRCQDQLLLPGVRDKVAAALSRFEEEQDVD